MDNIADISAHIKRISAIFERYEPTIVEKPLADFSGLRVSASRYCGLAVQSIEMCRDVVQLALENNIPLRTRGQGHSLNGSTLPNSTELLISTEQLRHVRFESVGTVTVGSGVCLWTLRDMLRRFGFDLPVLNDGYAGPSVGGFLASGGFGPASGEHGGFWNTVREVSFIDGRGQLQVVTTEDALFPWIFGSMGQFGIFVEAKLKIIARATDAPAEYPMHLVLVAPSTSLTQQAPETFPTPNAERLFWFTLFVPEDCISTALEDLVHLENIHRGALHYSERYQYQIKYLGRVAPLVYAEPISFIATGAWGWLNGASREKVEMLIALEQAFMTLAMQHPGYRRYIQSEIPAHPSLYQQYFGEQIYEEFRQLKRALDPEHIFNRGTVFSNP